MNYFIIHWYTDRFCKCGCGSIIEYNGYGDKPGKWKKGHNRKGIHHSGWSKGLTKENNEIMKRHSDRMKIKNPMSDKKNIEKLLKTKIENGTNFIGARKSAETRLKNGTQSAGKCKWINYKNQRVQGNFELRWKWNILWSSCKILLEWWISTQDKWG